MLYILNLTTNDKNYFLMTVAFHNYDKTIRDYHYKVSYYICQPQPYILSSYHNILTINVITNHFYQMLQPNKITSNACRKFQTNKTKIPSEIFSSLIKETKNILQNALRRKKKVTTADQNRQEAMLH